MDHKPINRSQTMDHNNLVSKPVVMGDFCTFQRQFETFLKMYRKITLGKDRVAYEAKQPEVTTRLEELTREFL